MSDSGRTMVISGAGRGIGLEWARQELEAGTRVIATARDPEASEELRELAASGKHRLNILKMDVTDDASIERAAEAIGRLAPAVDDLLHNAGVFGPKDAAPLEGSPDEVRHVLEVNAIGPYRVTRRLLPLLRKGNSPRIIFITSRMGSIGDSPSGGAFAYRMSKSALNMLGVNLAQTLHGDGILSLMLHPGWVRTRMGGASATVEVKDSVAGMRRVVAEARQEQSGTCVDFRGQSVPW